MTSKTTVFIILTWQEEGRFKTTTGTVLYRKERKTFIPPDYPQHLSCSNPNCQGGGFDIGDRISTLLTSGTDDELNSLICRNAVHPDRAKRCLHTIRYSITCIYPYQRQRPDRGLRQPFPSLAG